MSSISPAQKVLDISVADSRFGPWKSKSYTIEAFYHLLSEPIRGKETRKEFDALTKREQSDMKDVGGFVGGALKNGQRKAGHVINRCLVSLDIDNVPTEKDDTDSTGITYENLVAKVRNLRCNFAVYPTRKSRPSAPRLRVVFPTNRAMTADEYEPIARLCAKFIDPTMGIFDRTTFQPHRMMYWPSCCADTDYKFDSAANAPLIDVDGLLRTLPNWQDAAQWPRCPDEAEVEQRSADTQQLPTNKKGIIGAFCRVYDVPAAIEKFIPGTYERNGNRLTYKAGSSANGAILYQDGQFLYSHHATDPASEQLCNSFDLVRIHLFGDLDAVASRTTPISKMPSYEAMCHMVKDDADVQKQLMDDKHNEVLKDFDGVKPAPKTLEANVLGSDVIANDDGSNDLPTQIDHPYMARPAKTNESFIPATNDKGNVSSGAENAQALIETDPRLKNRIFRNTLSGRIICVGPFPWDYRTGLRPWRDVDYAGIRRHLSKYYQYENVSAIKEGVMLVANRHEVDPLVDYITGLNWDGVKRLDTFFIDYLGAEDNEYNRLVPRKALIGGVKRALVPGCKFDYMPILVGPQGCGKSTTLRKLGKDWFDDTLLGFGDDKAAEHIQGFWLVEVGELGYMSRQESAVIKQFLSAQDDVYRAKYGISSESHLRRCIIWGTTNEAEFLKDDTGNRRFWPVDVGVQKPKRSVWSDLTSEVVDQLWAEAKALYDNGEDSEPNEHESKLAAQYQQMHQLSDPNAMAVAAFCNRLVPDEYYIWEPAAQELYEKDYDVQKSKYDEAVLHPRKRVCAYDIQKYVFDRRDANLDRYAARDINRLICASGEWEKKLYSTKDKLHPSVRGFERKD